MRALIFIVFLSITFSSPAQKIKLVSADKQSWSGGMAGHSGTNYSVVIECNDTTLMPDTLWIGAEALPVNVRKLSSSLKKCGRRHKKVTYTINAGESTYIEPGNPEKIVHAGGVDGKCPVVYKGAALISYTYRGKRHYFIIKTLHVLPALNYP